MPDDSGNPYASPEVAAENAQAAAEGRMPGSVKLAIGGLAVFTVGAACNCGEQWYGGARPFELALTLLPPFVTGSLALGLVRRNRYAYLWARVLLLLLVIGMTLWLTAFIYVLLTRNAPNADAPSTMLGVTMTFWGTLLVHWAIADGLTVALLASYFSLGRGDARRWFGGEVRQQHFRR